MADGSATAPPGGHATEGETPEGTKDRRLSADLIVTTAWTVTAAAATNLPAGVARTVLTLPMILFVPGYLLLQAVAWEPKQRIYQALVAIGISPPLVGALALLTAIVPGGFRPTPIIMTVTVGSLLFAGVAYIRRYGIPFVKAQRAASAEPAPMDAD